LKNRCQTIGIHCSCCTSSSISWSNWCWWIKEIICKVSKNKQTKQKQNKQIRLKFDLRTRIFILLSWNGLNQIDLHFVYFNIDKLDLRCFLCLNFFNLKTARSKLVFLNGSFKIVLTPVENQFKKHEQQNIKKLKFDPFWSM
jgi:hypothetical protein